MSHKELELLTSVAKDGPDGRKFWATAFTVQVLSDWGVATSIWFHGCMCLHHTTTKEHQQCRLKGRRAINLACGAWKGHINDLRNLTLTRDALAAISILQQSTDGGEFAEFLHSCFQDCKAMMELRALQAWTFWGSLPFSLLELCRHLVDNSIDEGWSRQRALELIAEWDSVQSKTSMGVVAWFFFGDATNRDHILAWANHVKPLPDHLTHLLLGYSTALTVMQRLEARHHLVNLAVSRGRALSVAGVISGLRRRFNPDIRQPSFREELPQLLNEFHRLVPQQWESKRQLLDIVYGCGLDQLHPSTLFEDQQLARIADQVGQKPAPSKLVPWVQLQLFIIGSFLACHAYLNILVLKFNPSVSFPSKQGSSTIRAFASSLWQQ